jgi:hypothetical protein
MKGAGYHRSPSSAPQRPLVWGQEVEKRAPYWLATDKTGGLSGCSKCRDDQTQLAQT